MNFRYIYAHAKVMKAFSIQTSTARDMRSSSLKTLQTVKCLFVSSAALLVHTMVFVKRLVTLQQKAFLYKGFHG